MSRPAYPLIGWSNAGTTSDMYKLEGNQIVGFITPANIASTSITFTMVPSVSSGTAFIPVADSSGSNISFTTSASTAKYYGFSFDQIAKFMGVEVLKVVAGSSEVQNLQFRLVLFPRV